MGESPGTRYVPEFSRYIPTPYDPVQNPTYLTVWGFEKISLDYWRAWFAVNWYWSVVISAAYLTLIFSIQLYMRRRPPLALRNTLALWNFMLALFSFFGTIRTWPEMIFIFTQDKPLRDKFHNSVCERTHHDQAAVFWGLMFTLSKAVELGDTFWIILRNHELIFLHWYHHITVLGYTWFTYETYDATSRWFMVMNYMVHTLMYTYYGLKSLGIRVPRAVAMLITTLQLSQMIVGVTVNVYARYLKATGSDCLIPTQHIDMALIMYGSYFVLFGQFFYNAYFGARAKALKKLQ